MSADLCPPSFSRASYHRDNKNATQAICEPLSAVSDLTGQIIKY